MQNKEDCSDLVAFPRFSPIIVSKKWCSKHGGDWICIFFLLAWNLMYILPNINLLSLLAGAN